MSREKIENLLHKFSAATDKAPDPQLSEKIKNNIPHSLPHAKKHDTINIMIDLRISKLTAAAAIIITMVLFFGLYNNGKQSSGFYQESKLLLNYIVGSHKDIDNTGYKAWYNYYLQLKKEGRQACYFGDRVQLDDPNSILMYWKDAEDSYRVIFGDLRVNTINTEKLIQIQSNMLTGQKD